MINTVNEIVAVSIEDQTIIALLPFLKEVEAKINSMEKQIEYLQNRVQQLDSFH